MTIGVIIIIKCILHLSNSTSADFSDV